MRGIGYVGSAWPHGAWKGELAVARETIELAAADPAQLPNLHIQAPCMATARAADGSETSGSGVLEQLVIGPYAPGGFT